jgi:hypothetical protein
VLLHLLDVSIKLVELLINVSLFFDKFIFLFNVIESRRFRFTIEFFTLLNLSLKFDKTVVVVFIIMLGEERL